MSRIAREVFDALAELTELPATRIEEGWRQAQEGGYDTWEIPKGDGRTRRIEAPREPLREVQQRVLDGILYRSPVSPVAHGFVPGRSIVTNARVHLPTAKAMLSLDLENAFPSTSAMRTRAALEWGLGWFIRCSFPQLNKATRQQFFGVLTDLCCHHDRLPQGAATSGMALNIACAGVDRRCAILVRRNRETIKDLRYTRYADDLTFTASSEIPDVFRKQITSAIRHEGYRVNIRKVSHYHSRNADLVICGVRLSESGLTLPREDLKRYRSMFFQALAYDPNNVPDDVKHFLRGAIGFLTMVCVTCPPSLEEPFRAVMQHHASWLRSVRRSSQRTRLLPYAGPDSPTQGGEDAEA